MLRVKVFRGGSFEKLPPRLKAYLKELNFKYTPFVHPKPS
jgi:hypothetical protein